jgi:hypothetical protein
MEAYVSEQRGFFDLDERYAALSVAGDPLEKLSALMEFEIFRPALCSDPTAARAVARRWTR